MTVPAKPRPPRRLPERLHPEPIAAAPEPVAPPPEPPSFKSRSEIIIRETARFYGIHMRDMKGPRRLANIVYPRQVAMFLVRDMLKRSYPEIGRCFGNRDHTTTLHGVRRIARLQFPDPDIDRLRAICAARLEEQRARQEALANERQERA